jgi:hypothetical protein
MKDSKILALSLRVCLLALMACTSCIGSEPENSVVNSNAPARATANRIGTLSAESYFNMRNPGFFSESYPRDRHGYEPLNADAAIFFRYPDGSPGILASINQYDMRQPQSQAVPGRIVFYKALDNPGLSRSPATYGGRWQVHPVEIDQRVSPCIHARKILMADFNGDSIPDFAIMCHGYDAPPFPGEPSTILLSHGNGYILNHVVSEAGFHHGGSSADFNGDGIPDIAMTTIAGIRVYLNNGSGQFSRAPIYEIPIFRKAFHVELVDLNGDGHFDLVAGSHEWEDATRIVINPGNNRLSSGSSVTLPAVIGAGVIVDFIYVNSNNSLYILRTGDGQSDGTVFYQGLWLQRYSLTTGSSTVVFADPNWTDPRYGWPSRWLRWINEESGHITSNWGNAIRIKIE